MEKWISHKKADITLKWNETQLFYTETITLDK